LSETIAIFSPISLLSSVDLPALGRPMSATTPDFRVSFWYPSSIRTVRHALAAKVVLEAIYRDLKKNERKAESKSDFVT
jgi:hypothetical protein